jgi:hypothetical protein
MTSRLKGNRRKIGKESCWDFDYRTAIAASQPSVERGPSWLALTGAALGARIAQGTQFGRITMASSSHYDAAFVKQWLSALLTSSTFHFTVIVLLILLIDVGPRGGGFSTDGEIGIVLSHDSGAPDANDGEDLAAENTPVEAAPAPEERPPAEPSAPVLAEETLSSTDPAAVGNGNALFGPPKLAQLPAGDRGNYGTSDGDASVRVFGVEGRGTKFVYVFDRSTSMEGPPLATAKQQLIQSLESLSSVHQFHIIFFNQRMQNFDLSGGGHRIAFATDRNKKLAIRFVGGITADGGTDRFPALRAAVSLRPDVIFFLTDADDPMSHSELDEIAELNRRAGVAICTIEFGRGPARAGKNFLTELARTTSGQYGYVDTTQLPR